MAAGEAEEDRLRKRANRALWTGWQVRDVKRVVWVAAIAIRPLLERRWTLRNMN